MRNKNLDITVCDKLRACFKASPALLKDLASMKISQSITFERWTLSRIRSRYFRCVFVVFHQNEEGERTEFAEIKFGSVSNDNDETPTDTNSLYLWMANEWLYRPYQQQLEDLALCLELQFSHFVQLELAKDSSKNFVSLIRKYFVSDGIKTILNAEWIQKKDKNKDANIDGISFSYSTNLWRIKDPTLYVCQKKAIRNKSNGTSIKAYNKLKEIKSNRTSKNKSYILDFYGNPKRLHRLEITANTAAIRKYLYHCDKVASLKLLSDSSFLDGLFFTSLSSVLRFTEIKTRRKILWKELVL